jgi:hypothetical protein
MQDHKESLGATEPARRAIQAMAEFAEIIGGTIGEFMARLGPHVLGWIELRGVRREVVDVEPRMVGQERTDFATSMDRAAIPEQVDGATQMTEQVLEERTDVEAAEIPGATPEIKRPR